MIGTLTTAVADENSDDSPADGRQHSIADKNFRGVFNKRLRPVLAATQFITASPNRVHVFVVYVIHR